MQPLHSDLRGAFHKASSQKLGSSTRAGDLLIPGLTGSYAGSAGDSTDPAAEREPPPRPAAES